MKRSNIINFPQRPVFNAKEYAAEALWEIISIMDIDNLTEDQRGKVFDEVFAIILDSIEDDYEQD